MAPALVGRDLAEGHKVNPVALEGLVEAVNPEKFPDKGNYLWRESALDFIYVEMRMSIE